MSVLLFTGCAEELPSPSSPDGSESTRSLPVEADEFVCRRDDGAQSIPDLGGQIYSPLASAANKKTLFRCLRFLSATNVSSTDHDMRIVNIGLDNSDAAATTGQLHIPLHEIKTKAFLRNRSLAIMSDGKQFAALEKECNDIKASGVEDVVALVPGNRQRAKKPNIAYSELPGILPQEFIAERTFGLWHIVNHTSSEDLSSPLFMDMQQPGLVENQEFDKPSVTGLVRTLIVFDGDIPAEVGKGPHALPFAGQMFVLEGGLAGLRRYEAEAAAMARALARPRINERGCAG